MKNRRKKKTATANSDAKQKPPAFQLYGKDFLIDTAEWTDAEVGFFIRLLCVQWENRYVSNDINRLANIPGGAYSGATTTAINGATQDAANSVVIRLPDRQHMWQLTIATKFKETSQGRLQNMRMENYRQELLDYHEHQRLNGLKGAEKRYGKNYSDADSGANSEPNNWPGGADTGEVNSEMVTLQSSSSTSESNYIKDTNTGKEGMGEKQETNPATSGASRVAKNDILNAPPEILRFYSHTYEKFTTLGRMAKGVTQTDFELWKKFVRLVCSEDHLFYEQVFKAKFIFPDRFKTLYEKFNFHEPLWIPVLKKICSVGLEPKHDLWHRIPDAIGWLQKAVQLKQVLTEELSDDQKKLLYNQKV
jgi:hypothetical protein